MTDASGVQGLNAVVHSRARGPEEVGGEERRSRAGVTLEQDVITRNDRVAAANRRWLDARGILALNLVGAPGAGKTALLERMIRDLGHERPIVAIEGDPATERDADRIRAAGARALQVATGQVCHLDASMIARALDALEVAPRSILIVESVGNLACPLLDLGEHVRAVVTSVTESEDEPLKYPHVFRASDVMLLNKIDLLRFVRFDVDCCLGYARQIHGPMRIFEVSAIRGDGLAAWYAWVRAAARALSPPPELEPPATIAVGVGEAARRRPRGGSAVTAWPRLDSPPGGGT